MESHVSFRHSGSADEVAQLVKPGSLIAIPLFPPPALARALGRRVQAGLTDLRIRQTTALTDPGWFEASLGDPTLTVDAETFVGPAARVAVTAGSTHFLPNLFSRTAKALEERGDESQRPDVTLINVSPPDTDGWCNLGPHAWNKRSLVTRSRMVLAEVDSSIRRMNGNCRVHVDEIDAACFREIRPVEKAVLQQAIDAISNHQERARIAEQIAEWQETGDIEIQRLGPILRQLPAMTLADVREFVGQPVMGDEDRAIAGYLSSVVGNGSILQIGAGSPSNLVVSAGAFDGKQDLGINTEMACRGLADLHFKGVVTNSGNSPAGVSVAAAWTGLSDREIALIEDRPDFRLEPLEELLEITRRAAIPNLVSINSAIAVDLTGQINAETIGEGVIWDGYGGQPEGHISAFLSQGGVAVTVLRSTARNGTVSKIVPALPSGAAVTIPRFFADVVITEYGVAHLLGRNHRDRAISLAAIAHPDFKEALSTAAQAF